MLSLSPEQLLSGLPAIEDAREAWAAALYWAARDNSEPVVVSMRNNRPVEIQVSGMCDDCYAGNLWACHGCKPTVAVKEARHA
jgi:hypothetical protein